MLIILTLNSYAKFCRVLLSRLVHNNSEKISSALVDMQTIFEARIDALHESADKLISTMDEIVG